MNSRQRIGIAIFAFGALISVFAGVRYFTRDDSAGPAAVALIDTSLPGEESTIESGIIVSFGEMRVSVKSVAPRTDGQLQALMSFATTNPNDPVKDLTVTVGETIDVKGGAFLVLELGKDASPKREFARLKFVRRH